MFGTHHVIRFPLFAVLLQMVTLLALVGCQCLSPSSRSTVSPNPMPPVITPLPTPEIHHSEMGESVGYSAFRPIMPEQFVPPMPVQSLPIQESPKIESLPVPPQSQIDELNRRIAELESQLDQARHSPPPIVAESQPPLTDNRDVKMARNLPIINQEGVQIARDDLQNIRFEVIDQILFEPDTWQLSATGEETLRAIAAEIRAYDPKAFLDIEGHTDSLMSDPNNLMQKHDISSAKATAVMKFFVNALRWDAARIKMSSLGRSRPVADNSTPEGTARNNRIEIVVRSEEK